MAFWNEITSLPELYAQENDGNLECDFKQFAALIAVFLPTYPDYLSDPCFLVTKNNKKQSNWCNNNEKHFGICLCEKVTGNG